MKKLAFLEEEAEKWPGVTLRPVRTKTHTVLEVSFREQTRKITCSKSTSDRRATLNMIADLRRAARKLGAERQE